jgi:hypothetical protein
MELFTRFLPVAAAPREDALDIPGLLGAAAWQRLPAAVRRRFAGAHHDTYYQGALDFECSAIGRCFAWCAAWLRGPLTAHRGTGVPACVRVQDDGRGGMVWERLLLLPGVGPRIVRSVKQPGAGGGLVERTDGGLAMELQVFEQDGALVFESRRYFLALGRWRVPIPALLTPGTCRVEHRDEGGGRFRFTLSMVHPWWGRTFHQTGIFADPKEDAR